MKDMNKMSSCGWTAGSVAHRKNPAIKSQDGRVR